MSKRIQGLISLKRYDIKQDDYLFSFLLDREVYVKEVICKDVIIQDFNHHNGKEQLWHVNEYTFIFSDDEGNEYHLNNNIADEFLLKCVLYDVSAETKKIFKKASRKTNRKFDIKMDVSEDEELEIYFECHFELKEK